MSDKIKVSILKEQGNFVESFNRFGDTWFVYDLNGKKYIYQWRLSRHNHFAEIYE